MVQEIRRIVSKTNLIVSEDNGADISIFITGSSYKFKIHNIGNHYISSIIISEKEVDSLDSNDLELLIKASLARAINFLLGERLILQKIL